MLMDNELLVIFVFYFFSTDSMESSNGVVNFQEC